MSEYRPRGSLDRSKGEIGKVCRGKVLLHQVLDIFVSANFVETDTAVTRSLR